MADHYKDEKQETVKSLQERAERIRSEYPGDSLGTADYVKAIIGFFLVTAAAFGWMLLMLLIISFVTLSYLHFSFEHMLIISGVFGAVIAAVYVFFTIKKMKGRRRQ